MNLLQSKNRIQAQRMDVQIQGGPRVEDELGECKKQITNENNW